MKDLVEGMSNEDLVSKVLSVANDPRYKGILGAAALVKEKDEHLFYGLAVIALTELKLRLNLSKESMGYLDKIIASYVEKSEYLAPKKK